MNAFPDPGHAHDDKQFWEEDQLPLKLVHILRSLARMRNFGPPGWYLSLKTLLILKNTNFNFGPILKGFLWMKIKMEFCAFMKSDQFLKSTDLSYYNNPINPNYPLSLYLSNKSHGPITQGLSNFFMLRALLHFQNILEIPYP